MAHEIFANMVIDNKEDGLFRVNRQAFTNTEILAMEQERVFESTWLYAGHTSEVPEPGDFRSRKVLNRPVILVRGTDKIVRVFLNTCTHRGMKVCRYDEGNTPVFTCPYHGWSFATNGDLVGVPHYRTAYQEKLDKSQWGLIEVAQLETYKGTVWATWDPQAPSLMNYLGDMRAYLDVLLDGRDGSEGGSEVLGGVQKWTMPCNWKFPAENFSGDGYHNISHRSVDLVGIGPSGKGRRDWERDDVHELNISIPEGGHSALGFVQKDDFPFVPTYQNNPIVEEYARYCYEERQKRLGKEARMIGRVGNTFPNMSFLARQPRSIAVWHPRGTLKTEAWRWYLVDKEAPQEVKDMLRHYYMRYSGPAGLTEQDDMENWNYASDASKGVIARRYPYNFQMGMGFEGSREDWPGMITEGISEQNQRGFYKRWSELMAGQTWKTLTASKSTMA